jgi:hypothetical protein
LHKPFLPAPCLVNRPTRMTEFLSSRDFPNTLGAAVPCRDKSRAQNCVQFSHLKENGVGFGQMFPPKTRAKNPIPVC